MRRSLLISLLILLAWSSQASAQYGVPVLGPPLDPQGTLRLRPTIGVVHDAEFDTTGTALMVRGRYALLDEVSLDAHFGGTIGEIDDFQLGAGGKFALLSRDAGFPIDLVGFSQLDFGVGDTTLLSWFSGPIASMTFDLDGMAVTPYAGTGLGLTRFGDGVRGKDLSDETELAFGFIAGGDLSLSPELSTFTEFTFGVTDGLPSLSWHAGVSYAILTPPRWRAADPVE